MDADAYAKAAWAVGIPAFIVLWVGIVYWWGVPTGLALGWAPAAAIGAFAGFFWPITLLAVIMGMSAVLTGVLF